MKQPLIMIALIVAALAIPGVQPAAAVVPLPDGCYTDSLPGNDPRYPQDQLVLICIPATWNGQLVVYAHGYVAPQEPLALPMGELTLPDGRTIPEIVMSLGFGFATSSYHKNGFAIEQAESDLNALVEHVTTVVVPGQVLKTYITGASEGGIITTMLIEKYPNIYAGGLALCGPIGGMPYQMKYLADFRVVFDYYFPWVFGFGAYDVPTAAYQSWDSVFVPNITEAITNFPDAADQLFSVTRAARDPANGSTLVNTALDALFFSIWGTNDILEVAGGRPHGNRITWYSGSSDDLALNRGVERVQADLAALDYMKQHYQTSGQLERPLVTMHTTMDAQVPFRHELLYYSLAAKAGRSGNLTILPINRYGHCNFTAQELVWSFLLMVWKAQ